jgi:hypothetical protein
MKHKLIALLEMSTTWTCDSCNRTLSLALDQPHEFTSARKPVCEDCCEPWPQHGDLQPGDEP